MSWLDWWNSIVGRMPTNRTFSMGFTDYTHDEMVFPLTAYDWTWNAIKQYGDLVVIHEENSVPWTEALENRPDLYHPYYLDYIAQRSTRRDSITPNHQVLLYQDVLNLSRERIAGYRGETEDMPLPAPFDSISQTFSDPRITTAFVNHASFMIDKFRPAYYAYAVEANSLLTRIFEGKVPGGAWQEFVMMANVIRLSLKQKYPDLPILVSIQIDEFYKDKVRQTDGLQWLVPHTDIIAISAYPYGHGYRPSTIPSDYFTAIRSLDPTKPFAIAETGWPAQPVRYPEPLPSGQSYWYNWYSSLSDQNAYLNRLIQECNSNSAKFLSWFIVRDYDILYEKYRLMVPQPPTLNLLRLWRDNGIIDGNGGTGRPVFNTWNTNLARPRV